MSKWICGCGKVVVNLIDGDDTVYESAECVECSKNDGNYYESHRYKEQKHEQKHPLDKRTRDKNGIRRL